MTEFNPEHELKTRGGWLYWYALKNVWFTELYRRTGNPKYIADRLAEFEIFLTDEYEQMYQGMKDSKKQDMVYLYFGIYSIMINKKELVIIYQ